MKNAVNTKEMDRISQQLKAILNPVSLPISYVIGEKKYRGIPDCFETVCDTVQSKEAVWDHIFVSHDIESGLTIKTIVTEYKDYPVYDIVSYFTASDGKRTPILRNIKGFDGTFYAEKTPAMAHVASAVRYTYSGDYFSINGYERTEELGDVHMRTHITPQAGRSCDQAFPYFKLQFDGFGVNLAVGWPGQWAADFGYVQNGVSFSAGQEITSLYLEPGETIRTPKVTVMIYDGDYERGVNLWRRWYCAHVLPKPDGRPIQPQLCTSFSGGGPEFTKADEENQLAAIDMFAKQQIPYTMWWIDAGWYLCESDDPEDQIWGCWPYTGTWMADPKRFPNGLKPVSDKLHENGMSLLMWFEPERVRKGTEIYEQHPEWVLKVDHLPDGTFGYAKNGLLNLGIKECTDWLIDKVDGLIKEYGITVYRQDFNFAPLLFWRENESFDRQGITENLYVQGYLRYWDTLLERNPGLWIDSCSSGGRRNDLETMRRSVPLHPTDFGYGYQHVGQAFARTLQEWIPYYRIACLDYSRDDGSYPGYDEPAESRAADYFTYMAALPPFMSHNGFTGTKEDKLIVSIWERASKLMVQCDYYPLSENSRTPDQFCVNQYYRPEEEKGYVQAVRHTQCQQEVFNAKLRDIQDENMYVFDNMKTGQVIRVSGKELNENGFDIVLKKRDAAIWFYQVEK